MKKRTPLYEFHKEKAHIGNYAEYEMPIWYNSISEEVISVREKVGIFDVSHMGRVIVSGNDVKEFLDYIMTNEISNLELYQAKYSLMCNENGGIKDDVIVTKIDENSFLIVWNAVNRDKNLNWIKEKIIGFDADVEDISDESFMIAIQGPFSEILLQKICDKNLSIIKRFRGLKTKIKGVECIITRTGYTGEDGFELISKEIEKALDIWNSLISLGAIPAGLGARDVLRIEAGLPLYGNEIDENINPFEARLDFAVKMNKPIFIGKEALEKIKITRKRIGIKMLDKGIPRSGYRVYSKEEIIGFITSGTYSPILNTGIAMAYLPIEFKGEVEVEIRGNRMKGIVTDFPFYDIKKYGWKREKN
ncbi:MAG: glycine cleavage system aminomethyltransferase GcvT [Candidatus Methanomethylicaceae archaeon]|nr:glycine cleavage system aminomethyltransferase GcvT [Candidatus Verstraetearchaeota archaeon]